MSKADQTDRDRKKNKDKSKSVYSSKHIRINISRQINEKQINENKQNKK